MENTRPRIRSRKSSITFSFFFSLKILLHLTHLYRLFAGHFCWQSLYSILSRAKEMWIKNGQFKYLYKRWRLRNSFFVFFLIVNECQTVSFSYIAVAGWLLCAAAQVSPLDSPRKWHLNIYNLSGIAFTPVTTGECPVYPFPVLLLCWFLFGVIVLPPLLISMSVTVICRRDDHGP